MTYVLYNTSTEESLIRKWMSDKEAEERNIDLILKKSDYRWVTALIALRKYI
jgi:hypothetical protein